MRRIPLIVSLCVLLPVAGWAQDTRGSLSGVVVDSSGSPIDVATLTVTGTAIQGSRTASTEADGSFLLTALPVGTYRVVVRRIGYRERVLKDAVVRLGRTTSLGAIVLTGTPVPLSPIEARAERTLIDPVSTAGGVNLTPELYDNLPVNRDYKGLIDLVPQASRTFLGDGSTMAGGTGMENRTYVEGVEVSDPRRGLLQIDLPYNFIREVEIKTGGYEAEYKSSLGGIVNVVTYSGGDETRVRTFGFFASDQFQGTPRFAASDVNRSDAMRWDIGATLEGPITRGRLWTFLAYNPLVTSENVEIPGLDWYSGREVRHRFAGKVTWQAGAATNLHATVFGDPAHREVVEAPGAYATGLAPLDPHSWLHQGSDGGVTAVVGLTQSVGRRGLLEASVSRMWRRETKMPRTSAGSEPQFRDFSTGMVSGGLYARYVDRMYRNTARLRTSWELGAHTIGAGGEYTYHDYAGDWSLENVVKYADDRWQYWEIIGGEATVASHDPAFYLQDSWRVSPRLRFNAGLRWASESLVGSDGRVAQRIPNEWQPRLGFVIQPGELGSQRIYGSFGRFYQNLPLMIAGLKFNDGLLWRISGFDHDPREDPTGGVVLSEIGRIAEETDGLAGQHYDELTLGYERQVGGSLKLGVRGMYRTLRRAVEDAWVESRQDQVLGNPGFGVLDGYPRAKRTYSGLELTAEKAFGGRLRLIGSYVLSRTYGNYAGVYNLDANQGGHPNGSYAHPDMLVDAEGLLPQDRTHQLKLAAAYRTELGLTIGGRFLWLTGTPLSEMGTGSHPPDLIFLTPRGTAGRTPSIWEIDLRFSYDLGRLTGRGQPARLILDVFNLGNPRTAVAFDQVRTFAQDESGNQINPNPGYGEPIRYQLPVSVRLGLDVGF